MGFKLKEVQKTISLPDGYNEIDASQIGELIIKRIQARTKKGIDKNGNPFKYAKGSEFKGDGLEQTGDMLTDLEVIEVSNKYVKIGYSEDNFESRKAHGNITGSYGSNSPDSSKAKPFIGVSQDELDLILEKYNQNRTQDNTKEQAVNVFLDNLFKSQGIE